MSEDARSWKDQYMLRFPEGMRDRLKALAAENGRSLNAEIVHRLEQSLGDERPAPSPEVAAIAAEVVRQLAARDKERLAERIKKLYPPEEGE